MLGMGFRCALGRVESARDRMDLKGRFWIWTWREDCRRNRRPHVGVCVRGAGRAQKDVILKKDLDV